MTRMQPSTRPARLVGALAATALVLGLAACGDEAREPAGPGASTSTSTPTTSAPTSSPAPSPTTTGAQRTGVPVYWVGESRQAFVLYREFRTVPDVGDLVTSAVAAMTRMTPLDPDYVNPWRPASRVTVTQNGTDLAVDLSPDAIAGTQVGSELAARAVQQLVYTATAAASVAKRPASTVTVTIDGQAADAWGVVRLGEPTRRAPMVDVQAHAWVVSPQEGEVRPAGPVVFTGFGTSFEATFGWTVKDGAGRVVARGSAMGGTGDGGFGSLTFSVTLRPGQYTVSLATDDPSGGAEGRGPAVDTKRFVVQQP